MSSKPFHISFVCHDCNKRFKVEEELDTHCCCSIHGLQGSCDCHEYLVLYPGGDAGSCWRCEEDFCAVFDHHCCDTYDKVECHKRHKIQQVELLRPVQRK